MKIGTYTSMLEDCAMLNISGTKIGFYIYGTISFIKDLDLNYI